MRNYRRSALSVVLAVLAVLAVTACGSSKSSSSGSSGSSSSSSSTSSSTPASTSNKSGPITLLMGTAPDSLDPGFGYTTQAAEADWISYTGLVTYAHANGLASTTVIPGLATALPTVSSDGKTYTATLRKGLTFSNGQPVKASDFAYSVERSLKIPWGGSSFVTSNVVGAQAYAAGKAKTISGITTNDATGQITIHLMAPYGAFDNVLAFPAFAIVPSGTPMKNLPNNPPPGDGPYMIKNVVPNQGYSVVRNPNWAKQNVPGIPAGHVDVNVKISSNVASNALAVLQNSADVFDWADTPPGSVLPQIQSQASSRYHKVVMNSTYYIFMNAQEKPFNNQLVREAVVTGLDQNEMSRLGSGFLTPACYFLPPNMPGHPTAPCPYGDPASGGNLAKAKALIKQSGLAGTPVTVWSETRSPRQQWMTYYTQFLNQIGLKATQKVIADATYFSTIGTLKLHPQTGFADWNQDFPNPIDFYLLLQSASILPNNNENFGEIKDPHVDSVSNKLGQTPTSQLSSIASQWQALDEYVAKKAYVAVFGYEGFPAFTSSRISPNYDFNQLYGWDYTSFQVK